MKRLIILIMFIANTCYVSGQNESVISNSLTLSTGFDFSSLKDRTFSPIVFIGVTPKINLGFSQNRRNNALWHTAFEISAGTIDHENEYFSSTFIAAQFSFNYLSMVKSKRKSKIFFGGQFRSELDIIDYEGFESGSWYTAQQLDPILIYQYSISEKQSITGQFFYPIISLVGRPGYAGVDEFVVVNSQNIPKILYSKTKILSFNKLINPNLELTYAYSLPKISFSISANYSYLQVNSIRKFYKNELGANLRFHFKIGKKNEK